MGGDTRKEDEARVVHFVTFNFDVSANVSKCCSMDFDGVSHFLSLMHADMLMIQYLKHNVFIH